jgi:heme-degrading monooxygenase HmoA
MAEAFLALVIYPSSADAQTRQADNLANMASEEILRQPGLLRARVLLSEDGTTIMTLTEWRDRASFQKFRESDFGRAATEIMAELHPKSYWLREHVSVEP